MMKIKNLLLMGVLFLSISNVAYADVWKGDMTIEEGAEASISEEDQKLNEEKLQDMNAWLNSRLSGSKYMSLSVTAYKQKENYYCGPATTYQTLKFYKSSVPSQAKLAKQLGTTKSGTDMTKISGVLNDNLGYKQYSMISIGTKTDWINKVTYALSINKPVIIDIKTEEISGWKYRTAGHFLNVSGYDRRNETAKAKITDPHPDYTGSYWCKVSLVYKANNAHSRKAMIW